MANLLQHGWMQLRMSIEDADDAVSYNKRSHGGQLSICNSIRAFAVVIKVQGGRINPYKTTKPLDSAW